MGQRTVKRLDFTPPRLPTLRLRGRGQPKSGPTGEPRLPRDPQGCHAWEGKRAVRAPLSWARARGGCPRPAPARVHPAQAAERARGSVRWGPELRGGAAAGVKTPLPPALQITSRPRHPRRRGRRAQTPGLRARLPAPTPGRTTSRAAPAGGAGPGPDHPARAEAGGTSRACAARARPAPSARSEEGLAAPAALTWGRAW